MIFTTFRASPQLFGIPQENGGFNNTEYEELFKLYNRTVVKPLQKKMIDVFDKIFDIKGSITITPYSLNYDAEKVVD